MATKTKSVRDEALSRVLSREEEVIRQERTAQEAERVNAQARQRLIAEVQTAAAEALVARAELLPRLLALLEELGTVVPQLQDARVRYSRAVTTALRLKFDLDTTWPQTFGREPGEREALRRALQLLNSIGGQV